MNAYRIEFQIRDTGPFIEGANQSTAPWIPEALSPAALWSIQGEQLFPEQVLPGPALILRADVPPEFLPTEAYLTYWTDRRGPEHLVVPIKRS